MRAAFLTIALLLWVPLPLKAELIIVNQYGGGKSQLLDFSTGEPQTLWDKSKSGKIKAFTPLYGPVYAVGSGNLYFMESSLSKAYFYEFDLREQTTKVLWKATKDDTRQGVYNPWSFADTMAIDQESQIIYWSGRAAGRNAPTTFYGFDVNEKDEQPFRLEHISISTGRQIGQAVIHNSILYVSSIREGIWKFPLAKGRGRLLVARGNFEKGNFRGPALNPGKEILYFAVGPGLYSISLGEKHGAKKIGTLDFCCSTLHGLSLSADKGKLYITAQNQRGPGRKGSVLYRFDIKKGQVNRKGVPFLRTSSAAKNILSFQ